MLSETRKVLVFEMKSGGTVSHANVTASLSKESDSKLTLSPHSLWLWAVIWKQILHYTMNTEFYTPFENVDGRDFDMSY